MDQHPAHSPEGDSEGIWEAIAAAKTPEEFCRGWLAMQCRLVDGVSDAVVVLGSPEGGRFAPVATWPQGKKSIGKELGQSAEKALSERRSLVVKRDLSPDGSDDGKSGYHVAFPLQVHDRLHGVVALDVGAREEEQINDIVGKLSNGSAWLEGLLARSAGPANGNGSAATAENSEPSSKKSRSSQAEKLELKAVFDVVATALGEERYQAAATALVTELATRLHCERVSLGIIKRKRSVLQAMSHSANFGKKTNLTRAIERAQDEAYDQKATVLYPESSTASGADFRITKEHAALQKDFGAGVIASVPMSIDGEICAVLTLERTGTEHGSTAARPFDAATLRFCETLTAVVGPLIELRRRDDRPLVRKAGDSGRKVTRKLLGPGHLGWKICGILLLGAIIFFTFAKGDYRVAADTVIEGAVQRAAVAPFNGIIETAPKRAGDRVEEGEIIATLRDRDLKLEHVRLKSEHEKFTKQLQAAVATSEKSQVKILRAQVSQAKARLDQIEEQLGRLEIKAPFRGVIVQGDLSQSIGAPVQRGDVLFEIAPLDNYRVIQEVDERDIAHLSIGQSGHLVLSTFPSEKHPFMVTKITPVSTTEDGRNFFRVEAELSETPDHLQPGLEGVSKIEIDRRRVIWIWTHRAVDWARLTFWAWLP